MAKKTVPVDRLDAPEGAKEAIRAQFGDHVEVATATSTRRILVMALEVLAVAAAIAGSPGVQRIAFGALGVQYVILLAMSGCLLLVAAILAVAALGDSALSKASLKSLVLILGPGGAWRKVTAIETIAIFCALLYFGHVLAAAIIFSIDVLTWGSLRAMRAACAAAILGSAASKAAD